MLTGIKYLSFVLAGVLALLQLLIVGSSADTANRKGFARPTSAGRWLLRLALLSFVVGLVSMTISDQEQRAKEQKARKQNELNLQKHEESQALLRVVLRRLSEVDEGSANRDRTIWDRTIAKRSQQLAYIEAEIRRLNDGLAEPPAEEPLLSGLRTLLPVAVHADLAVEHDYVARALRSASAVLSERDSAEDFPCELNLVPAKPITRFSNAPLSLYSASDLSTAETVPGVVKLFGSILYCGPTMLGATLLACSVGESIFVTPVPPDLAGVVWAHELGHLAGLPHRYDKGALMNVEADYSGRIVSESECERFRTWAQSVAGDN